MIALIADNQDITRYGLKCLATASEQFPEVRDVADKRELIRLLTMFPDAVVVLDYTLFDISAEYLQIIQTRFIRVRWILFSDHLSVDFMRRILFCSNAFSVVLKDSSLSEIKEALRFAVSGKQYICPAVVNMLSNKEESTVEKFSSLTATEKEILKFLALGRTTKEIASERFLSVHTVMTHRKNIFRKLGVNNVHEATKYALRAGIVDAAEYYI